MAIAKKNESSIGVTAFKSKCLGLIDEVAQGKTSRIVLMKHNRPVAAIVPVEVESANLNSLDGLWGAMEGMLTVAPGVDITEPVDVEWDALK